MTGPTPRQSYPAFVLGLALSAHYARHRKEQERLRVVAFAFLTPLFFLKGGMSVSVSALWANLGVLGLLFLGKMVPKLAGVYPLARRYCAPHAGFTTLLMSTGLTFGTISSLYGLNAGIIDRDAVLTPRRRRRPLGHHPHGDRAARSSSRTPTPSGSASVGASPERQLSERRRSDAVRSHPGGHRRLGRLRTRSREGARARRS